MHIRTTCTVHNVRSSGIVSFSVYMMITTISIILLFANSASAGSHEGVSVEYMQRGAQESKIYGVIEKLTEPKTGTWIVHGREIIVTKNTRIREKHGKAETGAYVEVEGVVDGKTFTAYEIEVKRAR